MKLSITGTIFARRLLPWLAWLLLSAATASADPRSPQELIGSVTGSVLDTLRTHVDRDNDKAYMVSLIEEKVVPYFDFRLMAAQVLGRYWRTASDAQRERFTAEFRQLLTNTYAAVFGRYSGQTVDVLGAQDSGNPSRVLVATLVKSPGKPDIRVDYRMYQTSGNWLIYDVVADGISLLINYRSEYATALSQGSLDNLIARLEAKNAAFNGNR